MSSIKKCRYCGNPINIDTDTDWCLPGGKGWYYHKECYIKKDAKAVKNTMKKCLKCGGQIDKNNDDWCMPIKGKYYHKKCYTSDEEYVEKIYSYLKEEVKMTCDRRVCENQRKTFINKYNYTNEGIYNALKYFYSVKKGSPEKSGNRIGIVSYIYNEAQDYYNNLKRRQKEMAKIVAHQLEQQEEIIIPPIKEEPIDKGYLDWRSVEVEN